MINSDLIILISAIVAVEAITEVVIKSVIFLPIRNFFISKSSFFEYLLSCGYCFSFWSTLFIIILLNIFNILPILTDTILNYFLLFFIIQRGSNILHGSIDRYFDTRKDIRYNQKE